MKDLKRTPVPLPGTKSKGKAKANNVPTKPALSQEFVDSDDDSSKETMREPEKTSQPKTTIAIHTANGVLKSKSKSKSKPKPKSKSKDQATEKVDAPATEKAAPKKPSSKQIVTPQQVEELSSSEISDDSDVPARDIQTKLPDQQSDKDSDSDSSSDTSSDESTSDHVPQSAPQTAQKSTRPTQSTSHAIAFKPAQAYEPPKGFAPLSLNHKTASKATELFQNLQGKQIWHITAPAGVSLKDLKELAMSQAMDGEAMLSYKGTDYGFGQAESSEEGVRAVLVPSKNGYRAATTSISHTLHLQEVVRLPKLTSKQADQNTGSEAAASITRSTIRAPRPQVTGLKMRFLPTGFGGDDTGTLGDSEDETQHPRGTAGLGVPRELNLPSKKEKRKHAEVNGTDTAVVPEKKSKKYRTPEEMQRKEERRAKKEKRHATAAA